jgi:membrane-bound lytic murein transglycosylase D
MPNQPLLVPAQSNRDVAEDQIHMDETAISAVSAETATRASRHKVRNGDSVYSIAKRYGMTVKQLMAQNDLKNARLRNGQVLSVSSAIAAKSTRSPVRVASASTKTRYTVRRGETLSSIAKKFNVAASDLQRWNNLNGKHSLMPGRKLVILKDEA